MSNLFNQASLVLVPSGYKAGKVYSQVPTSGDGDLTFTRASDATRVNSDGLIEVVGSGVPRLDYSQGSCPALLLEPQRTNLSLYSEEFDNASWAKDSSATVTANTTTAPDGNTTADTINLAAVSNSRINQVININNSTTYTVSGYFKNIALASGENISMIFANTNAVAPPNNFSANAFIDLFNGIATYSLTGTSGTGFSGSASGSIENVGNGWYRVSLTFTTGTAAAAGGVFRLISSTSASPRSFYAWGAQVEQGAYATSYIPTTSATVTRLADACSKTGISSLIGQTEGTMFVEFDIPSNTENGDIIAVRVGTSSANGFFVSYRSASVVQLIVRTSSTNALVFQRLGAYPIGKNKLAVGYKNGDFGISLNGTAAQVNTSTITMPTSLDAVALFSGSLYTQTLPIQYAQVLLFPTRLTNAELAELTTL